MLELKPGLLLADLWLPRPINEVFEFFSNAENLEAITPPALKFWVTSKTPIEMRTGTLIDYKLRLNGLPLRWRSEITVWDPPCCFVDEQRKGPYRSWRHEHRFAETDGGTTVHDDVRFAVWGGKLIERLFVERDLKRIFQFRQQKMQEIFGRR